MNKSLIDTDIFSYYMKGNQKVIDNVVNYLIEYPSLSLSYITFYEILKGLEYKKASKQIIAFQSLSKKFTLINIDRTSLEISAKVYGKLKRNGIIIGTSDLFIAGIAIANNLQLITNNTKHFKAIQGLNIDNWT